MARQGRIHIPGGLYHVIVRGIERHSLFRDARDRLCFLKRLGEGLEENHILCYAWSLMDNHAHLLLSPQDIPLGVLMRSILTGYAVDFNHRHKRIGHVFHNRYKSIICQKEKYFLELVRYIHLNPLRAGLVKTLKQLECYPWCGHGGLIGQKITRWQQTGQVLCYFGTRKATAIVAYKHFVQEKVAEGPREEFEGGGVRRSRKGWERLNSAEQKEKLWSGDERILGDVKFVDQMIRGAETKTIEQQDLIRLEWDIGKIEERICEYYKIEKDQLRRKMRIHKGKEAKALLVYLGIEKLGMTIAALARYLSHNPTSVSRLYEKGKETIKEVPLKPLLQLRPQ